MNDSPGWPSTAAGCKKSSRSWPSVRASPWRCSTKPAESSPSLPCSEAGTFLRARSSSGIRSRCITSSTPSPTTGGHRPIPGARHPSPVHVRGGPCPRAIARPRRHGRGRRHADRVGPSRRTSLRGHGRTRALRTTPRRRRRARQPGCPAFRSVARRPRRGLAAAPGRRTRRRPQRIPRRLPGGRPDARGPTPGRRASLRRSPHSRESRPCRRPGSPMRSRCCCRSTARLAAPLRGSGTQSLRRSTMASPTAGADRLDL